MADTVDSAPAVEVRRVPAACRFCRYSKLKCSGTQPCDRCQKRSQPCIYKGRTERASSQDRSERPRKRPRSSVIYPLTANEEARTSSVVQERVEPNRAGAFSSEHQQASPRFLRNRPNKRRRWLYLGASSTWTFNVRITSLIRAHLKIDQDDRSHHFTLDGDAYNISLKKAGSDAQPDLSRLPSQDYAVYLINTVKFHLGDILRLFDEDEFLKHLHDFYSEGPQKIGTHRLWYTQFLLLLALGKGFLNARKSHDNGSSAEFFSRAMSILPDVFTLHEDPVLATEVLATIALYFYCVDMRQSAYSYIGQALRIALVEGMHIDLPAAELGRNLAERCRKLWWTVYILDRTLSSAVGAPVSVQDNLIGQPLDNPRQCSQREATLVMHVKLCRIVSYILTELYAADGSLEHSYLTKTRAVLRDMAETAKELEDTINFKFKTSLETISKGALYLRLLYNQCIMLATRPLLLSLLQQTLRSISVEVRPRINIPSSIRDLLQTCVDSATKTLKMLWALNDHNLLDTFLPFNLEFACSAGSILIVTDDVLRGVHISSSHKLLIDKVVGEIAAEGNKAAPLRQRELRQLSELAEDLWTIAGSSSSHQSRNEQINAHENSILPPSPRNIVVGSCENVVQANENAQSDAPRTTEPEPGAYSTLLVSDTTDIASTSGMSSNDFALTFDFPQEQILLLADHLDEDAISTMFDSEGHGLNEWF